jgi:hypothetical protein
MIRPHIPKRIELSCVHKEGCERFDPSAIVCRWFANVDGGVSRTKDPTFAESAHSKECDIVHASVTVRELSLAIYILIRPRRVNCAKIIFPPATRMRVEWLELEPEPRSGYPKQNTQNREKRCKKDDI